MHLPKTARATLAAALTLTASLALVAAPTPATIAATPAAATLYGPKAAPNGVGDMAWYRCSEWNGWEPKQYGTTDWWIVGAPADPTPELKRRSEFKAGASQAAVQIAEPGKKTQWKGWLKPVLGAAANDGRSWHSLVQLHGPESDGTTYGFAHFALRIVNGYWQAWGSTAEGTTWSQNLMPYTDDYATYATITVLTDETMGLVSVRLDPASSSAGDPPAQQWNHATEPWSNAWLVWSSGLYRGSGPVPFDQGGIQPTYEQRVYVKDVHVAPPY